MIGKVSERPCVLTNFNHKNASTYISNGHATPYYELENSVYYMRACLAICAIPPANLPAELQERGQITWGV